MDKSETITTLIKALTKAQSEFEPVKRTVTNTFFGAKYATLDSVLASCIPILTKHALLVIQPIETLENGNCVLETRILHMSGEWLSSKVTIPQMQQKGANALQEFGIGITYMRRYMLSSLLGISTEDDNDGNKTQETKPPQRQTAKPEYDNPADVIVGFGKKHKGETLGQILKTDKSYVEWLATSANDDWMKNAASEVLNAPKPFDIHKVNWGNNWDAMFEAALEHLPNVTDLEKAKQTTKEHFKGKATASQCWDYMRDEYKEEPELEF